MSKPRKGLAIIMIDSLMYCANCGMLVVNNAEWKEIHLSFHEIGAGSVSAPKVSSRGVGAVDRPSAEEIAIEKNPRLKAEYKDTEKLMGGAKEGK